jgi:AAA domain-containing protein
VTEFSSSLHRPPFVTHQYFLETAFEQRFQGLLHDAWKNRSWHVIAAIPGSGKSLGIADLVEQYTSYKESKKITKMPLLAIRAPKNGGKEQALAMAFSTVFGVVPSMPWYIRRVWIVDAVARAGVECLIIDDAQDLNLTHLAFLKELTDNLAAPPHNRQVGLCLVTAISGNVVPFKEVFTRPDTLWRQFRRRLDTTRPFCTVLGHTFEETCDVLLAFEDLYRSQLPEVQLCRWAKPIFTWLTHPTLDPDGTKRVTMDHLTRFVVRALCTAYEQGATDVDATVLEATADLMILRRDEMTRIDGLPSKSPLPIQEVG